MSHVSGVEGHAWAEVCTEVGVWAGRASHHGHRLAAVGAHGGGREAGAEGLAALAEVLNGAVDLCGNWSALASPMVATGPVTAMSGRIGSDRPHRRNYVPSNCEAKALATSLLTVELVPTSM